MWTMGNWNSIDAGHCGIVAAVPGVVHAVCRISVWSVLLSTLPLLAISLSALPAS